MAVPTRQTSEAQLNQFNAWLKEQPWYQQFFASRGKDMNRVELSRGEQGQLESLLARNGVQVPDGMHIDQAGNLNQKNRLARNVGIGAGLTAAALGTMGAAGIGPAAGLFGGGGSGVGAAGLGSGMNAATAGAAAHAGSPLMMGSGALTGIGAGASALPTLASTPIGTGMGTTPSVFGPSGAAGAGSGAATAAAGGAGAGAGRSLLSRVGEGVAESGTDRLLNAAFAALAGLPGILGNNGPSDEERAYQSQATRLLGQQEQRTQFQNPLYEAATRMAFGLLPNMGNGGKPYPINSLSDVSVPGLEDLLRTAQRRT